VSITDPVLFVIDGDRRKLAVFERLLRRRSRSAVLKSAPRLSLCRSLQVEREGNSVVLAKIDSFGKRGFFAGVTLMTFVPVVRECSLDKYADLWPFEDAA
jgi:hypothetical protein